MHRNKIAKIARKFLWSVDNVSNAVDIFVNRIGVEEIPFCETRLELLKICIDAKNPETRWLKASEYLKNRLHTQLNIKKDSKSINYYSFTGLLKNRSLIKECIKCIIRFNASEISPNNIYHSPKNFHDWHFKSPDDKFELRIETKSGDIKGALISKEDIKHSSFKEKINPNVIKAINIVMPNKINIQTYSNRNIDDIRTRILSEKESLEYIKTRTKIDLKNEPLFIIDSSLFSKYFPRTSGIVNYKIFNHLEIDAQDFYLNSKSLCIDLAEKYLSTLPLDERENILLRSLSEFGYEIFFIRSFQDLMNSWEKNRESSMLELVFTYLFKRYSPSAFKKKDTESRYYFFMVAVNDLIDKGYDARKASIAISNKIGESSETIRTQYHKMRKKMSEESLTVKNIKEKYGWFNYKFENILYYYQFLKDTKR